MVEKKALSLSRTINRDRFCLIIMNSHTAPSALKTWTFFLVHSFVILLFVSPDGWLYDLNGHCDSAWFFMCGKAWMSGLTPYVDFTDSKGPLLWLIYGIGYLISHSDYLGVFAISCLWFTTTFYYIHKTCLLFAGTRVEALWATCLMTIFLFNPLIHYETRAEDFALLFIAISNYHIARAIINDEVHKTDALIVGACCGALMLIKYNLAFYNCIFVGWLMWLSRKRLSSLLAIAVKAATGATIVMLPFVVYLAINGALDDCIQQYGINSLHTMRNLNNSFTHDEIFSLKRLIPIIAMMTLVIATSLIGKDKRRIFGLMNIMAFLVFFLPNTMPKRGYYMQAAAIGYIPIALWVVQWLSSHISNRHKLVTAIATSALAVLITIGANVGFHSVETKYFPYPSFIAVRGDNSDNFNYFANIIGKVKHPTVCYLECMPHPEFGVKALALPACKYWATQNGRTEEMFQQQWQDCKSGKPDFIIVTTTNEHSRNLADSLSSMGYSTIAAPHRVKHPEIGQSDFILLSKRR